MLYILVEHGGFPTKHAAALPGAKESLECEPGTMRLVLQNRKGFARLALRTLNDQLAAGGWCGGRTALEMDGKDQMKGRQAGRQVGRQAGRCR